MGNCVELVDSAHASLAPWGRGTDSEASAKNQGEGAAHTRQTTLHRLVLVTLIGCQTLIPASQLFGDTNTPLITGSRLRQELQRPINVTRPDVRLREIIQRLAELHHIAILLDRRIDPDQQIDVQLSQVTLMDGLELLAHQVNSDAALVGGTVVIGPVDALDRMRTEIVIQHQMLKDSPPLFGGKTIQWEDLQSPTELLPSIAERFDLNLTEIDLVPHDLWAAGIMADVSAVEALTLVAGQFDLTCLWSSDASSVQLAPAHARLTIEKTHQASPQRFAAVKSQLMEIVPLAKVEPRDRHLQIVATVGEHERIEQLLKGESDKRRGETPDQGPLRNRTFTLTAERSSVIALLRTLESQGTNVEYDSEVLSAAGIDLSQKVSLSLDKATADEFFRALCEPLGLQFEIDGKTVRLSPATAP